MKSMLLLIFIHCSNYIFSYAPDRKSRDPVKERAEFARLKHEHKRAMTSAKRELRKDASYLANVRLQEQEHQREERQAKYKEAMSWLQEQAHDGNMQAKAKQKKRRF